MGRPCPWLARSGHCHTPLGGFPAIPLTLMIDPPLLDNHLFFSLSLSSCPSCIYLRSFSCVFSAGKAYRRAQSASPSAPHMYSHLSIELITSSMKYISLLRNRSQNTLFHFSFKKSENRVSDLYSTGMCSCNKQSSSTITQQTDKMEWKEGRHLVQVCVAMPAE